MCILCLSCFVVSSAQFGTLQWPWQHRLLNTGHWWPWWPWWQDDISWHFKMFNFWLAENRIASDFHLHLHILHILLQHRVVVARRRKCCEWKSKPEFGELIAQIIPQIDHIPKEYYPGDPWRLWSMDSMDFWQLFSQFKSLRRCNRILHKPSRAAIICNDLQYLGDLTPWPMSHDMPWHAMTCHDPWNNAAIVICSRPSVCYAGSTDFTKNIWRMEHSMHS